MSDLGRALFDALTPEDYCELENRLAACRFEPAQGNGRLNTKQTAEWLTTKQAAEYLGMSVHALRRLTAQGKNPFHQERPGAKCHFRRAELEKWQP